MVENSAPGPHQSAPRLHAAMDRMENLFDFRRLWNLVLSRWWIIALIVGFAALSTLGYLLTATPIYESRAVLQVQQQEQQVLSMDQVREDNPSTLDYVNSVVQALTSRNLLLRVINANNLRANEVFAPPRSQPYSDIELADLLEEKVTVKLRRLTRLVEITVQDPDPELARNLAASFVKEFLRENFSQRMTVSQVANDFLKEEAGKLKAKLEDSERKLQAYKENNQAVSLDERQNIIVEQLKEINTQVTVAQSERMRLEADIEQVRAIGNNPEELMRIGSVAELPQVKEARELLLEAESQLAELQDRYLQKHPKHIAAVRKVASLRESLNANLSKAGDILGRQYAASQQTEAKLAEALKGQESTALDLNNLAIPFNVLQREVESDRAMYESVIKRMKETAVSTGIEQAPFTLIEEPMVASKPSKPRKLRTLALALVLSSLLAVGGLVLYDNMDTSLRSIDDAEAALELSSLAGIPDHRSAGFARFKEVVSRETDVLPERLEKAKQLAAKTRGGEGVGAADWQDLVKPAPETRSAREKYPIATIDNPSSALAEAYRTLRANLAMLGPEENRRILLFVSAIPEEGKTYTSLNTAAVLAQQGHKTLLVDVDLRRPSMHKALLGPGDPPPGLTDIFTGNAKLEEVIRPTPVENLFFLSAGTRAPNPAELIASADVRSLIAQLGEKFERVIFDSAPVNAVSDTLSVAPHVHKTILVVRAGKTPRKASNRALMLLRKSGAKVAGFVLNRLPTGRTAGYYYYYYGDKYEKDSAYGGKKTAA
jgi:capsular exopolysaccharide synthesis family protein